MVNIRDHNEASAALSAELGREPTQSELADFMGKNLEDFHKERTHAYRFQTVSLESQVLEDVEVPAVEVNEPETELVESQLLEALAESIEILPEREKTIISLAYRKR